MIRRPSRIKHQTSASQKVPERSAGKAVGASGVLLKRNARGGDIVLVLATLMSKGKPKGKINRKISLKNRKIIGRLGCRGFQTEMRGAVLASFDKQLPSEQIGEVSVRSVVGHVERLATPSAVDRAFPHHLNHDSLLPFVELQRQE
jgi:hypothetical protein